MNRYREQNHEMGLQDFFTWRSQTAATLPAVADEDVLADTDEPPDHRLSHDQPQSDFFKSTVRPQNDRKESLLTKAFQKTSENELNKPEIQITTDLIRRRSMMSNASLASTAELTSDGGLTSPARTNTPSPPFPNTAYTNFAPYSFAGKPVLPPTTLNSKIESKDLFQLPDVIGISPKVQPPVEAAPRKRCITFMCDGKKDMPTKPKPATSTIESTQRPKTPPTTIDIKAPQPRRCTIQFACPGPKHSEKSAKVDTSSKPQASKPTEVQKKAAGQSSFIPRKSPRPTLPSSRSHRDSSSTIRRASQSPVAIRAKPKYIIADEKTLQSSEITRFHEFASEELQEDDWILKETEVSKEKLTINDTLKMENAIRRLGNEAEQEALEEDEDEEDDEANDSDDEIDFDEDEDEDEEAEGSVDGSDEEASDGNETDNEAGFAESDESDAEGDFAFWTPGRKLPGREPREATTYRASAHRTASISSIDSLNHMEPPKEDRMLKRRPIKIRPGTPDLPDSTDFVCGTLDEDRPIEEAYVSCMEARKNAKHKQTPQDIDPSFPTTEPEDEEDENDEVEVANDSDEHIWLHGKFEESDDELHGRRRSTTTRRKPPHHSPRRLHSPPPPKRLHSPPPPRQRLRSPPPRKLFGHSPKRMRSPPPARTIRSPPASPTAYATSGAINFAPLGSRPGLTHTKSLPRTPNAFCRQYRASRLVAANGNNTDGENDGHVRGAIDIVKGLEQKRQRRKEKFYQKQSNRKSKGHSERRPQPGKGAERMRELGLLMAGKTGAQDPYMLSA